MTAHLITLGVSLVLLIAVRRRQKAAERHAADVERRRRGW